MPKLVDRATYSTPPRPTRVRRGRATAEQVAAWQALARAFTTSMRAQGTRLEATGLDSGEYDVLFTLLGGPPEGMRPSELTERALITKSGMTRLLQRLEERGLIERRACLTDKRGQLIAIAPQGRHLVRRATPAVLRGLAAILSGLSPAELASLTRASERMTEAATAHSPV